MAKWILNSIILPAGIVLFNACSPDLYQHQAVYNVSRSPGLVSSYNSAAVPVHPSGKVHVLLGLFAWGDASIRSAKTLFQGQQGAYIIQRVQIIDRERHTVLGCGFYRIDVRGNIQP